MGYSNWPKVAVSVLERVALGGHFRAETDLDRAVGRKRLRQRQFRTRAGSLKDRLVSCSGDAGETRLAGRDVGKLNLPVGELLGFLKRWGDRAYSP